MYPPEGNKTEKPQTDAQDEDSQNETEEESGTDAEKKKKSYRRIHPRTVNIR